MSSRNRSVVEIAVVGMIAIAGVVVAVAFSGLYLAQRQEVEDQRTHIAELDRKVADAATTSRHRDAATQAACAYARLQTEYAYGDLASFRTVILAATVNPARQSWIDSWDAFAAGTIAVRSTSYPGETSCGLIALEADTARVQIFVRQILTSAVQGNEIRILPHAILTLRLQADGNWLISNVKTLQE